MYTPEDTWRITMRFEILSKIPAKDDNWAHIKVDINRPLVAGPEKLHEIKF
jgi:hypothetical protein